MGAQSVPPFTNVTFIKRNLGGRGGLQVAFISHSEMTDLPVSSDDPNLKSLLNKTKPGNLIRNEQSFQDSSRTVIAFFPV